MILTVVSLAYDVLKIIGALLSLAWGDLVLSIIGFAIGCYFFIVVRSFRFVSITFSSM
jgi:hypothetical protein